MNDVSSHLLKMIEEEGAVEGDVVNVEKFLNHRINFEIMDMISKQFINKFPPETFDTILTVESSGIALASFISAKSGKDIVFIKKKKPLTMKEYFFSESFSYTKQEKTTLFLSKSVVASEERFLFVDDFFARGDTFTAVKSMIKGFGGILSGCGVIIDKSDSDEVFSILKLKKYQRGQR